MPCRLEKIWFDEAPLSCKTLPLVRLLVPPVSCGVPSMGAPGVCTEVPSLFSPASLRQGAGIAQALELFDLIKLLFVGIYLRPNVIHVVQRLVDLILRDVRDINHGPLAVTRGSKEKQAGSGGEDEFWFHKVLCVRLFAVWLCGCLD